MKKIFSAFRRWEGNPRNSQKVGSDSEPSWGRLQPNRRAERNFLWKRKCREAGGCFSCKKNGAKRTLLRHGGDRGNKFLWLSIESLQCIPLIFPLIKAFFENISLSAYVLKIRKVIKIVYKTCKGFAAFCIKNTRKKIFSKRRWHTAISMIY